MSTKLSKITGNDSLRKYFDSPYMGAYSISDGAEPIVTISDVLYGKITLEGGRREEHILLHFAEKGVPGMDEVKPLVLNATNQKTLEKLYGKGADVLRGKKIRFYIDPAVRAVGGGTTEGVRIRAYVPRESGPVKCADTDKEITATEKMTVQQIVAMTQKRYGRPLSAERWMELVEQEKAAEPATAEPTPTETEAPIDTE